jgi:hypothetical protein
MNFKDDLQSALGFFIVRSQYYPDLGEARPLRATGVQMRDDFALRIVQVRVVFEDGRGEQTLRWDASLRPA